MSSQFTARDVIRRSMRLIRAIDPTEEPQAEDFETGLTALNMMMHGFEDVGIYMDYENIEATDFLPTPNRDVRPIVYILAAEIAPEFGMELTPEVAVEARQALATLQAQYGIQPDSWPDRSIQNRLSRYGGSYDIRTDGIG